MVTGSLPSVCNGFPVSAQVPMPLFLVLLACAHRLPQETWETPPVQARRNDGRALRKGATALLSSAFLKE